MVALARTQGGLEELDDEIRAVGGQATLVTLDLRKGDDIDQMGFALYQKFGRLDILAGIAGALGTLSPVSHIPPKDWTEAMEVNLTANYRLMRSFDALLRQSDAGRAIFVTDARAKDATPFWGAYAASKAELETLARSWATETARDHQSQDQSGRSRPGAHPSPRAGLSRRRSDEASPRRRGDRCVRRSGGPRLRHHRRDRRRLKTPPRRGRDWSGKAETLYCRRCPLPPSPLPS